jgi:hypothetical protein
MTIDTVLAILGVVIAVAIPIGKGWLRSVPNRYITGVLLLFAINNLLFTESPWIQAFPFVLIGLYYVLLVFREDDFGVTSIQSGDALIDEMLNVLQRQPQSSPLPLKVLAVTFLSDGHPVHIEPGMVIDRMMARAKEISGKLTNTPEEGMEIFLGALYITIANLAVANNFGRGEKFLRDEAGLLPPLKEDSPDAERVVNNTLRNSVHIVDAGTTDLDLYGQR